MKTGRFPNAKRPCKCLDPRVLLTLGILPEELCISLYTAKNHVSSILHKLGLKGRRELS